MQTLALLARKGGVGKTTVALHLAVIAQQTGRRVLIIDCDPQQSASDWRKVRSAEVPEVAVATPGKLPAVLNAAANEGVDLCVIDTRPSVERDTVEIARRADLILVPTRPAVLDLRAIGATVDVVKALGRPAAILLNGCPPGRGAGEASVTVEARRGLQGYGLPIIPQGIAVRAALAHALIDGRAVVEFEPDGKAAGELRRVWNWVEERLWAKERR